MRLGYNCNCGLMSILSLRKTGLLFSRSLEVKPRNRQKDTLFVQNPENGPTTLTRHVSWLTLKKLDTSTKKKKLTIQICIHWADKNPLLLWNSKINHRDAILSQFNPPHIFKANLFRYRTFQYYFPYRLRPFPQRSSPLKDTSCMLHATPILNLITLAILK
jgi:hypothetical protein